VPYRAFPFSYRVASLPGEIEVHTPKAVQESEVWIVPYFSRILRRVPVNGIKCFGEVYECLVPAWPMITHQEPHSELHLNQGHSGTTSRDASMYAIKETKVHEDPVVLDDCSNHLPDNFQEANASHLRCSAK
jgi:hypothetical protein